MATSGTTAFDLQFTELAEEAFERAGREMRAGYDLRTARVSMNLLTIEWQNRGINLWTIDSGTVTLVSGTVSYALPADTIDLLEQVVRTDAGSVSNQQDINMTRISMSQYAAIPNKLSTGKPLNVWIDRGLSAPTAYVWPVPDQSGYTMVYWRMRRIEDAGRGVQTPDVNFRFYPALAAGLAFYIAQKIPEGQARLPQLEMEYEKQFRLAAEEDRVKTPFRLVPRRY